MLEKKQILPKVNRMKNISLQFVRFLVGILFIFSGLVKANDPSGLAYKMQEFFEAWQMTGLSDFAFAFSIMMIAFEIIAGAAVILGYFFRFFSFLILLLMAFFTYLTAYAVFSGKIKECGCFGDCIPLESIQSFYKDLILLALVLCLFIFRNQIKPLFKRYISTSLMIITMFFSLFIQWWTLEHLPFIDCLPYKIGNNILEKMQMPIGSVPDEFETKYELKNDITGESKVMSDKEYISSKIWEDTSWHIVGDPVTKLIKKGNAIPEIEEFYIADFEGNNKTESILKEPGYNFLFILRDATTAEQRNMEKIAELLEKCKKNNIGFFILSSGSKEETEKFMSAFHLNAELLIIDATVSKTMMRSNPGLILIKAGTIKGKWSYNDYPKSFEWTSPIRMKVKK